MTFLLGLLPTHLGEKTRAKRYGSPDVLAEFAGCCLASSEISLWCPVFAFNPVMNNTRVTRAASSFNMTFRPIAPQEQMHTLNFVRNE
jgi:hypothetical protein